MTEINRQIDAYLGKREVKEHDRVLLEIISKKHPDFSGSLLDIGCAAGAFIDLVASNFPNATYTGFDISEELIQLAKDKMPGPKFDFFVADALDYSPSKKYDIAIASGVLSIFEDFSKPLNVWLSWLNDGGVLYVFGRFNSRNIDTVVRFRNNYMGSKIWEGGLTSYSTQTIARYLEEVGFCAEFTRFHLPIELEEREDPIRTFTKDTVDGLRLTLNGANIIAEHYYLAVSKLK